MTITSVPFTGKDHIGRPEFAPFDLDLVDTKTEVHLLQSPFEQTAVARQEQQNNSCDAIKSVSRAAKEHLQIKS
jgi:hypothetical protein